MQSNTCQLCHRETECHNLGTILVLMKEIENRDMSGVPESLLKKVFDFKQQLKDFEYQYPDGNQTCGLVHEKALSRSLVDTGSELLKDLNRLVKSN